MKLDVSRRGLLRLMGAGSIGWGAGALGWVWPAAAPAKPPAAEDGDWHARATADCLTTTLQWNVLEHTEAAVKNVAWYPEIRLEISAGAAPLISCRLPGNATSYRIAVSPDSEYRYRLVPLEGDHEVSGRQSAGSFRTGKPVIEDTDDDAVRYRNPRIDSHWGGMPRSRLVQVGAQEPLSPWFDRKSYLGPPPPRLEDVRQLLPLPVLESDGGLIDLYWYCWRTLFSSKWLFPPTEPGHQAVANLLGAHTWAGWGSTMVWDTCFMLHFARYAHAAYPFITALDNCYARQHENGFICREADAQNREVYWDYPLNPPLFAWAEWEHFQLTGDAERLGRVLPPIVRHYEWFMRYQRRKNGLYWNNGYNEADDSPRNDLMYYAASASSYQAMAALYLARIAKQVGRADLEQFFHSEHASIGQRVNTQFWDAEHSLYNDRAKDGRFITELAPGVLCKHVHMFWPLIAEIAEQDHLQGMLAALADPRSFNRSSGVPSLSADSRGFRADGQYWKGAVWPPTQCMVQEGLRVSGQWKAAQALAQKYLNAVLEAFNRQQTITENLAPDSPVGHGQGDFVGWGGIGPVSNLIEYVLGFHVNAPQRTLEWHIGRTDRHGIQNLRMGYRAMDLVCERRATAAAPCHITVQSSGDFTLSVHAGEGTPSVHAIPAGRSQLVVPPEA